jgi:LysM repeat protein
VELFKNPFKNQKRKTSAMQNQRTSTMSTPNPLMPQGALQRPSSTTRSKTLTAISVVITLHVVVIVAVLMGCNRDSPVEYSSMSSPETLPKNDDGYHSEAFPPSTGNSDLSMGSAEAGAGESSVVSGRPPVENRTTTTTATMPPGATTSSSGLPETPESHTSVVPPVPTPSPSLGTATAAPTLPPEMVSARQYSVRPRDTFSKIASKHGVSLNALLRANPTSDPKRLQIGKSINIPASAKRPPAAAAAATSSAGAQAALIYEVQPGDNLTVIARKHGTMVNAIKALNRMRSDRIKIGDKLKIPAR